MREFRVHRTSNPNFVQSQGNLLILNGSTIRILSPCVYETRVYYHITDQGKRLIHVGFIVSSQFEIGEERFSELLVHNVPKCIQFVFDTDSVRLGNLLGGVICAAQYISPVPQAIASTPLTNLLFTVNSHALKTFKTEGKQTPNVTNCFFFARKILEQVAGTEIRFKLDYAVVKTKEGDFWGTALEWFDWFTLRLFSQRALGGPHSTSTSDIASHLEITDLEFSEMQEVFDSLQLDDLMQSIFH